MNTYTIGDKKFELKKLGWKQRSLTRGFYEKFFKKWFESLTALDSIKKAMNTNEPLGGAMAHSVEISMEMNDILYGSDDLPTVLATILSPEGVAWDESLIEENKVLMEEISDDTLREVLGDFFTSSLQLKSNSLRFSPGLQSKKTDSIGEQKSAATEAAKDSNPS